MKQPVRTLLRRKKEGGSRARLLVLVGLAALVILPSLLALEPYRVDLDAILVSPSMAHPLGTDENGRDVLARLLLGARETIGIGMGATILAMVLGTAIGSLAGYRGGLLDSVLMRAVDMALAFPSLFAVLLFAALFSSGAAQLILLIGCTGWMVTARLVRARVLELLATPYVEAARSLGASGRQVICRHLVPNLSAIVFVAALVQLGRSILAEATISFLGFGVQPPTPTWGNMLIGAQNYVYTAPWLALAPGVAITGTLVALSRLGLAGSSGRPPASPSTYGSCDMEPAIGRAANPR